MIRNKIAVIGAGITGLTAAHKLQKNNFDVSLFERKGEPGGSIKTVQKNGWQIEYGPNTVLLKDAEVAGFIEEIGLAGEKVTANPDAKKRYIVKNGELQALPFSFVSALTTPLFSFPAKLRVIAEPLITRNSNRDQTVADFAERRLGKELLDYAINPFIAGIYANRPENLSLRHTFPIMDELEEEYGSLIWGQFAGAKSRKKNGRTERELISFKKGMQQLPLAIAKTLNNLYLNHEVKKIERRGEEWIIHTQMGDFGPFDEVILNIPTHKWNRSLLPMDEADLTTLQKVNYPPLSVLLLGYMKDDIEHPLDGFGFLVPEKERRDILGALFSSTLFRGRAPEDCHLLTVFVGGGRQPELAVMESEQMMKMVELELSDLIGLKGEAVFKDHVYWPNSIPGYHVGYDEILETMTDIESRNTSLHLAGNYREGVSVPDCIKNGLKLAVKIIG
jgi:protoporphyrinogen/coproporphyrinogen III oxidase